MKYSYLLFPIIVFSFLSFPSTSLAGSVELCKYAYQTPSEKITREDKRLLKSIFNKSFNTRQIHKDANGDILCISGVNRNIKSISSHISKLTNLQYLYLGYNQLTNIPAEIENMKNLKIYK